ncbi:hypothetical protein C6503_09570 [Candidatus Poribacteria bacterium]|nr:MAG: hypothetical protein C6503_09570 [Candidatus Poribacteria bacterium]
MGKTDLQEQAVTLIRQLSTEKLKSAVDYLVYLQDAETRNVSPDHEVPSQDLGTAIHELFKPFGGVELEIPPREPMREPPRFD